MLKYLLALILLVIFQANTLAQKPPLYNRIDSFAIAVNDTSIQQLAARLTAPCKTEAEKVRALFRWMTAHIDYDVEELHGWTHDYRRIEWMTFTGTETERDSQYNLAACQMVLGKRKAICDGYSRFFKTLCGYAGIECKIVTGYTRKTDDVTSSLPPVVSHAWNAVRINRQWQLIDVTWASGYCNEAATRFTRRLNGHYYLAAPGRFAFDHFPDDAAWLLLTQPPTLARWYAMPYRTPALWDASLQLYPEQRDINYGTNRHLGLKFALKKPVEEPAIYPDEEDHAIIIHLQTPEVQATVRTKKKPATPDEVTKPLPVQKVSAAEGKAIDELIAYINSTPAAPMAEKAPAKYDAPPPAPLPPYKLTEKSLEIDYPLPAGNFRMLEVYQDGKLLLQYGIVP